MHDNRTRIRQLNPLGRQPIEPRILADGREQRNPLPFKLQPQHHDDLHAAQCLVEIVVDPRAQFLDSAWHHRRRPYQPNLRAQLHEGMDVRPRHTAMRHISDNRHRQPLERQSTLANRIEIQEALRRVLMPPVSGVDHGRLHPAGQGFGCAGRGVTQHDNIRLHRFNITRGVE
ncbi:MAG: hypothetical protein JW395_2527 [Nitrospira sp.]|nr:hypothetical protein [Nitrospira sp.]